VIPADAAAADADYLRRLPKAEVHCHLMGSVPPRTVFALAGRYGVPVPTADPDRLYRFSSLEEFLALFGVVSDVVRTPADLAEITYASLCDAATTGTLRYREMSVNPTNHDLPYRELMAGVLDGVRSARADAGVDCRLVVAVNREQSAAVARDLVRAMADHRFDEVIGLGMDHNEKVGPPGRFAEVYAAAAAAGFALTAHAGERGDTGEVADTIDLLHVARVDHGYAVLDDADLVTRARDGGIAFGACWSTCTFHHGAAEAARRIGGMAAAGLRVCVNSDDPPMFGTDLGQEFVAAGTALGWTRADAARAARAGVDCSLLDAADRARLLAAVDAEIAALDAALPAS